MLLTEALLPHLRQPGGRVVFLSAIAAFRGSGAGCYRASKAALHPYRAGLAKALGLASPDALHVTGQVIQVNGGAERSR